MKKYDDYKENPNRTCLTNEELGKIDWTKFKIVVPTKEDRDELIEALKHIHDSDIDTDFITVNQIVHEYTTCTNIIVDSKLYNKINTQK